MGKRGGQKGGALRSRVLGVLWFVPVGSCDRVGHTSELQSLYPLLCCQGLHWGMSFFRHVLHSEQVEQPGAVMKGHRVLS